MPSVRQKQSAAVWDALRKRRCVVPGDDLYERNGIPIIFH